MLTKDEIDKLRCKHILALITLYHMCGSDIVHVSKNPKFYRS